MTYMTYMTYYKQLAFAAISPVTFLCGLWRLEAAASYIEGDVSPVSADVSVAGGRKKNVFLLKMDLKKLTMQVILYGR